MTGIVLTPNQAIDVAARWLLFHKVSFYVVLIALIGNYLLDEHGKDIGFLSGVQRQAAGLIWKIYPDRSQVTQIAVVEVDSFFREGIPEEDPTDRLKLARLIEKVLERRPAVIALDIFLTGDPDHNSEPERALLGALTQVLASDTQLVVARTLASQGTREQANIFSDAELHEARFGYVNLPFDQRRIPLEQRTLDTKDEPKLARSFALQAVTSLLKPMEYKNETVEEAIAKSEFVFGGFRPAPNEQHEGGDFPHLIGKDILNAAADRSSLALLNRKLVFIGSTWQPVGGNRVDIHPTPLGLMRGVYIHANYAQALLSGRVRSPLAPIYSVLFDLTTSIFFIVLFENSKGWRRLRTFFVFLIPITIAYFLFVNLGIYVDFALPLLIILFHGIADGSHLLYETILSKKGHAHVH